MAATTSLFVGGFDAYTKNTPAGYGLFMGGGLLYLGVPGAGFVDAYFALKGLFDC
jgi:hypothetical protein